MCGHIVPFATIQVQHPGQISLRNPYAIGQGILNGNPSPDDNKRTFTLYTMLTADKWYGKIPENFYGLFEVWADSFLTSPPFRSIVFKIKIFGNPCLHRSDSMLLPKMF